MSNSICLNDAVRAARAFGILRVVAAIVAVVVGNGASDTLKT